MKFARNSLFFFLLVSLACQGANDELQLRGYLKSWALWSDAVPEQGLIPLPTGSYEESQSAFRLMLDYFPPIDTGPAVTYQLHYEIQPVFKSSTFPLQSAGTMSSFTPAQDRYRLSNPDSTLAKNGDKSDIYHNLDRLNLRIALDQSDLTIGRQAIALGAARSVNPTDIFVPYSFTTLNQEYRQGVDAIRWQYALGQFSELDAGFIFGHHMRDNGAWTQLLFPAGDLDLSVIVARANEDWMWGGGLQGSVGDSGVWLEAAQLRGTTDTYNRYTVGMDRTLTSLTDDLFFQLEYHYNGPGSKDPVDYLLLYPTTPWQEHGVFFLGRQYLIPSLNWQASALLGTTASFIYNIDDQSWLLNTSLEFSLGENLYLDAGAFIFYGNPVEQNTPLVIIPHSEFGSSPDSVYASLRYYF